MHFDQREQTALREAGLDTDDIRAVSDRVGELVADTAGELETFFDQYDTCYSEMDLAHSGDGPVEHTVSYLDCYTHGGDLHGWLRFETWGVAVTDGRVLDEETVELTLEGRHGRTRFTSDPGAL